MTPSPSKAYTERLEERRRSSGRLEILHRRIGNLRLLLMICAVVLGWLWLGQGLLGPAWLGLPGGAFLVLVGIHERVLRRKTRLDRAAAFYERGLARLEDRWIGTGEPGIRHLDEGHPYAADLDLFGKGSLFELICTARTRAGEDALAAWLCEPAEPGEIRARQAAIGELKDRLDLREELSVLGGDVQSGVDVEALTIWGSAPSLAVAGPVRLIALLLAVPALPALAVWLAGHGSLFLLAVLLAQACFHIRWRARLRQIVQAVDRPGRDLDLLAQVLERMEKEQFQTPSLQRLRSALDARPHPPSSQIGRLRLLIDLLDSRRNQLFAPVAAMLLWAAQFGFAIEEWRRNAGPSIERWLKAVGEFEALCALAGYAFEHPDSPFPELVEGEACFIGEGLAHPLLGSRSVRNDLELGRDPQVLIVSGSNMSGKSTLLRTVGTNTVLALAGAPVCAQRLRLSPMAVGASLRILDSLQGGSSRFYAEITRLRRLVDLANGPMPLLFLLDELLAGTNSHDRRIGAEAVVNGLLARGAIGLLTTHDLALAQIAEALSPRTANVHFEDHLEDGKMMFDYRLHPGVVRKSNALELMRSVGLEV